VDSHSVGSSVSVSVKSKSLNSRGRRNRQANCLARQASKRRAAAAGKRITAPSMSLAGLMGPSDWVDDDTVIDGADCSEMMKHWSDIPSFSDLVDVDTHPGLASLANSPPLDVQLSVTSSTGHTEHFSAKDIQACDNLRGAIARRFSCAKAGFILRDVEAGGSIVPVSPTLTGTFKLEIPRADTRTRLAPPLAPAPVVLDTIAAGGNGPPTTITMKFLQEPPHGSAVWLHAKLTSEGAITNSCRSHVLKPPPRIRLLGGDPAAHRDLLARVRFELYDAAGERAPSSVLHAGEPAITRRDCGEEEEEAEEEVWEASWPQMAITDSSRSASGCSLAQQKLSAAELQAPRGATGWFCLRAFVPAAASDGEAAEAPVQDLWLRDANGRKARIVVKNERNAALSWQKDKLGPYADHSLCAAHGSHIGADGKRLCQHGNCTGSTTRSFIKTQDAAE